jgi:hypothetical protein
LSLTQTLGLKLTLILILILNPSLTHTSYRDLQSAMLITDGKEDEKLGNGRASLSDIFPSIGN